MFRRAALQLESVPFIPNLPEIVVTDLDGTLAIPGAYADMSKVSQDVVNPPVLRVLAAVGLPVVVLSARPEKLRDVTLSWLNQIGISPHMLLLSSDRGSDSVAVKMDMFNRFVRGRFNVVFAIDDSAGMVKAWRSVGIACFDVAGR